MDSILEYKSITGEIKDLDLNKRVVMGYLSSFGYVDKTDDAVEFGAFTKTLQERANQIFFLNQHNWAQPHGKFQSLVEDTRGLYFESTPLPDTTYSSDVLKLYEAGIIKEHSIGFQTIKSEEDENNVRHITEVKLFEGSNVTLGANDKTPYLGLKTSIKEIDDQSKLIYKAIRNGTFTDETFNLLELALKQLQQEAFNLGKKSLEKPSIDTYEPISVLHKFNESFI